MGGDYAISPEGVQFMENSLCYGAAGCRLRSSAEFIYQNQRFGICRRQHGLHISEEGAIGGEVILKGLVISNRHHNAVKDRQFRCLRRGDEHSPLEHILQQAGGFEADALSAGVGAGDKEDALCGGKGYSERNNCLFLTLQGFFQERMTGFTEHQGAFLAYNRHSGNVSERNVGLCHNEVQLTYKLRSVKEFRDKRPQEFRKFIEDFGNFAGFGKMEL